MPEALKTALDAAALENKRSLTAEIVARLQASFDAEQADISVTDLAKLLDAQEARLKAWALSIASHTGGDIYKK